MRKILLFITGLVATATYAQPLQNQHKTVVFARTWSHCADSYTKWCLGAYDTLSRIQNTTNFPAYFLTYDWATTYGMTNIVWPAGSSFETNNSPNFGNQPAFAVSNRGIGITEIGYEMFNSAGTAYIYPDLIDTLYPVVQRYTSTPAEASVGFTKTMITPDSVLIQTKTRFNINDSGMFSVAVYAVQDSARGWQATTIPGVDTLPRRNIIRGTVQYGIWGYPIGNDTMAHAGDEFLVNFTCHIPADWNAPKLRYVVAVYKAASIPGTEHMINVTDGNFTTLPTGMNTPVNADITGSMTVFPVPAKNYVNVKIDIDKELNNCTIGLYNINGKKVGQLYSGIIKPSEQLGLQLPQNLPAGNYMLELHNDNISAVKQVTIK